MVTRMLVLYMPCSLVWSVVLSITVPILARLHNSTWDKAEQGREERRMVLEVVMLMLLALGIIVWLSQLK